MSTYATERGREAAQQALQQRRDNPPEKIDNASLPAGAPMYYYCRSCGYLADVKPEDWFRGQPAKLCGECQALKDMGWLDD